MINKTEFLSLYIIYLSIFIEQTLDQDSFSDNEISAITNISIYSFLATDAFIQCDFDHSRTLAFIKNQHSQDITQIIIETLDDILSLYPELSNIPLNHKFSYKLSTLLFHYIENYFKNVNNSLSEEEYSDIFSFTMYIYETLMLLDQYEYNIEETIENLEEDDNKDIIIEILSQIKIDNLI